MYAKIKDGSVEKYPYSITDLKQDNPNVSFPKVLDSTVLNSFGQRNDILKDCDWTVLPDAPLSADMVAKWKTYRQELRDITKQASFNNDQPSVTWPNQPK